MIKLSELGVRVFLLSSTFLWVATAFGGVSKNVGGAIKCKKEQVKDDSTQLIAFDYFMPAGWEPENSFRWTKPGLFESVLSCSTADHLYGVTQLEHTVVSYGAPRNLPPTGVRIHHAGDYLRSVFSQIGEKINAENVEVVEETNEPIPPEKLNMFAGRSRHDAMDDVTAVNETGFLQVKFTLNGVPMSGSLGTTILGAVNVKHMPGRPEQVVTEFGVFGVGPTTVIISPEKPDPRKAKELRLIASSMTMTQKFYIYWMELTTRLAKMQIGANAAARKFEDENFHDRSMGQFREVMGMKDAYTHQFCNYVQDQQDYKDSRGERVTLPSSFKHAWDDGQGDYLLTDDPTTDPRGYGSGNWKPMAKARIGE